MICQFFSRHSRAFDHLRVVIDVVIGENPICPFFHNLYDRSFLERNALEVVAPLARPLHDSALARHLLSLPLSLSPSVRTLAVTAPVSSSPVPSIEKSVSGRKKENRAEKEKKKINPSGDNLYTKEGR